MTDPVQPTPAPTGYADWLADLKGRTDTAQQRAALAVNRDSPRNLHYMRAFAAAWPDAEIVQRTVGRLPWGHNLVLLTRLKDAGQRLAQAGTRQTYMQASKTKCS